MLTFTQLEVVEKQAPLSIVRGWKGEQARNNNNRGGGGDRS